MDFKRIRERTEKHTHNRPITLRQGWKRGLHSSIWTWTFSNVICLAWMTKMRWLIIDFHLIPLMHRSQVRHFWLHLANLQIYNWLLNTVLWVFNYFIRTFVNRQDLRQIIMEFNKTVKTNVQFQSTNWPGKCQSHLWQHTLHASHHNMKFRLKDVNAPYCNCKNLIWTFYKFQTYCIKLRIVTAAHPCLQLASRTAPGASTEGAKSKTYFSKNVGRERCYHRKIFQVTIKHSQSQLTPTQNEHSYYINSKKSVFSTSTIIQFQQRYWNVRWPWALDTWASSSLAAHWLMMARKRRVRQITWRIHAWETPLCLYQVSVMDATCSNT